MDINYITFRKFTFTKLSWIFKPKSISLSKIAKLVTNDTTECRSYIGIFKRSFSNSSHIEVDVVNVTKKSIKSI